MNAEERESNRHACSHSDSTGAFKRVLTRDSSREFRSVDSFMAEYSKSDRQQTAPSINTPRPVHVLYIEATQETMVKELHKTVTDMQTAIAFLNRISGELNLDALMDMVRSMALELLECERVTLFLADDSKQELRGKPAAGLNEPVLKVRFGEGIAGHVAETGVSLNVENAYQSELFCDSLDRLTGFKTVSILCCPITDLSKNIVAVLEAVNKKSGHFTWKDENTINLFVLQIGNTLAKSQLHQRALKEGAKIATLSSCTKKLHHAVNLDAFLKLSREAIQKVVDAQYVLVFLADAARSQLWTKIETDEEQYTIARTDMKTGSIGSCFEGMQLLDAQSISETDQVFLRLKRLLHIDRCRCVMMHPIAKDDVHEKLGVVVAIDKKPCASSILSEDTYTDADKAMLSLFCRDVYDLLLKHAVEISFVSALSTVLSDGTNANTDQNVLLQSQLMEYADADEEYMRMFRLCESSRYAESDGALLTLIHRSCQRSMSTTVTNENGDSRTQKARKRSDLGPIDHLKTWSLNFIDLPAEELVKLCFDVFQDMCPSKFEIEDGVVISFLKAVASHYRENPYHTFLHACYVLHAVWMILSTTDLPCFLLPYEILALYIAAICHDVDHDGFTNQFHVNTGSEVARRYNDISVLENHHCTLTFAILERKSCAILASLPKHTQTEIRRVVIQYIMGTDMSHHFKLTSELCQLELPRDGSGFEIPVAARIFLGKSVLHAADISNPARSFEVDFFMAERVQAEFKNQTMKEKQLGLPVLPHMDLKTEAMKFQAEVNFIDCIVMPLWKHLALLFPSLELCLHQMRSNKERFVKLTEIAESKEKRNGQSSNVAN